MPRPVIFLAMLFVGLGSIAHGEELFKDDAMKAWASFVGKWKMTTPAGTMTLATTLSPSKSCFIQHGEGFTVAVGWDPGKKVLKSISFLVDGSQIIGHYKVVGDAPKFSGEFKVVGPDGAEQAAISATYTFLGKDCYEMVGLVPGVGEMNISAERIK